MKNNMVSKKTKPMMNKKNDLKKTQKQKNGTNCKENVCEQIMKLPFASHSASI